jgi:two-component system, NtrC family, response regulator AtoC
VGGRRESLVDSTLVSSSSRGGEGDTPLPRRLMLGTGHNVSTHSLPEEGIVTLGRAPDASIRVEDPSVSRLHVRLHMGAVVRVEDLGSANGTKVAGARLRPHDLTPLPAGQVVEIGSSWLMIANAPLTGSTVRGPDPVEIPERARRSGEDTDGLVIRDEGMRTLHELIERVSLGDISVVLYGETGVGKEVFARRIHALSPRASKPFVGLNCAALATSLLESELFGFERGAFTGAVQTKPGLLETAQGGTLLLDEIGEMPVSVQVKLLRVLEERQVLRIGGTRPRPIDVRVLSATHRNLEAAVELGTFRRDLFFRLNGITLEIPPLRQRPGEIEPLARGFAAMAARRLGAPPPEFDNDVWDRLRRYQWPGNIRQLRNVMERALVMADGGRISIDDFPADTYVGPMPKRPDPPVVAPAPVAVVTIDHPDAERRRISEALEQCAGNQTRAAAVLGISRRTLVTRLAEYNFPRPRKRGEG